MKKQILCIGVIISFAQFDCSAMDPREVQRYKQYTLLRPALPVPAPDDVQVDMHSAAQPRVLLGVQEHLQMLRRRNTWASDDSRLRMFDGNTEEESCIEVVRRCGCSDAGTCSRIQQTALQCMSLQSMVFYFDVLRLLRRYNQ